MSSLVPILSPSPMSPRSSFPSPQTPPPSDPLGRPRSILLEPALYPSSPYSRSRFSPSSHSHNDGVFRARQSVSSIGSCSTRSAPPIKSILTRHDSGISMATTSRSTRRKKKRSPSSVKFVDAPTVHYDNTIYYNTSPPRSPPSPPSEPRKPTRWFTKWWKKSPTPPSRPFISGPYHISYTPSLVDLYAPRTPKPKPGRLKQIWHRLTSVIR